MDVQYMGNTWLGSKRKNIIIVFSTKYPNKSQLSKDKWRIFEISKDMEDLVEKKKTQ